MKKEIDYIIVGQGLAGSILAWQLHQKGKKLLLIDPLPENTASQVAAGIINPITGRRFVKSWRFDEFSAYAKTFYQSVEQELQTSFYHSKNILRTLFNHREQNDWINRSVQEEYAPFIIDQVDLNHYKNKLTPHFAMGEMQGSAQVDIPTFTKAVRTHLKEYHPFLQEKMDYDLLEIQNEGVIYKEYAATSILFCEGHQALHNPYFNYLSFVPAKGEVLIARIPKVNFKKLLKHRIFIVPLQDDLYWIGATYEWNYDTHLPTEKNTNFLEERLREAITSPFEIIERKAAIRPTVKDRRPFIGFHPKHSNIAIFNGLGTKGASLGPFWANHFCEVLEGENTLSEEVSVERFLSSV